MPRTTVNIDAPILREVKRIQRKEDKSLGQVISELLAQALAGQKAGEEREGFRWNSRKMETRVNLADKEAVYAVLEERWFAGKE